VKHIMGKPFTFHLHEPPLFSTLPTPSPDRQAKARPYRTSLSAASIRSGLPSGQGLLQGKAASLQMPGKGDGVGRGLGRPCHGMGPQYFLGVC
jgi:hypothetical protein